MSARPFREEVTDIPNVITIIRIAMIPAVLVCIDNYSPKLSAIAAVIFTIVAGTDALDGYLARRLGLETVLGKFLDPLADKLLVLSVLVVLVAYDRAPAWLVVALQARELAITGLRGIASQKGLVIAAGAGGKAKTALQLTGIAFLLIHFEYPLLFVGTVVDFHELGMYFLYASLVLSVLSALEYFKFFIEAADKQAKELAEQGITRAALKAQARERRAKNRQIKATRRDEKMKARRDKLAARRGKRRRKK